MYAEVFSIYIQSSFYYVHAFWTSLHGVSVLVFLCEYFFSHTTDWAEPVVRQIFKSCSGSDTSVRIPIFRIINIAARLTYIFFHLFSSVRNLSCPCPGYFPKHHLIVIAYIISDKNTISLWTSVQMLRKGGQGRCC